MFFCGHTIAGTVDKVTIICIGLKPKITTTMRSRKGHAICYNHVCEGLYHDFIVPQVLSRTILIRIRALFCFVFDLMVVMIEITFYAQRTHLDTDQ